MSKLNGSKTKFISMYLKGNQINLECPQAVSPDFLYLNDLSQNKY